MKEIIEILGFEVNNVPVPYGIYHIICFLCMIILNVVLVVKIKNPNERTINKLLLTSGIILLCFECYKQFVFTFSVKDGVIDASYAWYAFPFQFCSIPMYVFVITPFTKGKMRDALLAFLATYGLFAGIIVMLLPTSVFTHYGGINIQTMVHHSLLFIVGSCLLITKTVKIEFKTILKGCLVMLVFITIALILNLSLYNVVDGKFNMFYISPYYGCELPVLSIIRDNTPYLVFLFTYFFGFMLAATIVMYTYKLVEIIVNKIKYKNKQHVNNIITNKDC